VWSASLRDPRSILVAQSIDEVIPVVRAAEAAAKSGSWVALAISYDAAPAFDDALDTHRDAEFPLVWCGIFDERSSVVMSEDHFAVSDFTPALSAGEYLAGVEAIKAYIAAGDTYQVNYTFPLRGTVSSDLFSCFRTVARSQGAGYSAYLDIGSHRILSFSPELFFRRDGMKLTTKPMKGTARRGRWIEEDDDRVVRLASSAKDRAENVMIVDLLRNDLGRVAEVGSVNVPALFVVERFNRVLQMTSTITATQKADADLASVLGALFPCGSVTGAPKVRSMQIIRELEPHPRGIYTGAIGLLSPSGDMVFNVAIRTLAVENSTGPGRATLGVGGGITWESTVEGEYEESLLKASFLTERWPEFSLLETLALIDGEYTLLQRHIGRAADSARYFGFAFSEVQMRDALDSVARANSAGEWRVRLLIDPDGSAHTEYRPLGPKRDTPLRVRISPHPIDDTDPLVFHKISARERYHAALAECQPCDDVIFMNARGEVTESTIANIVVELDGKKWTPPREAGLLGGTMRAELIARGEVFERPIAVQQLQRIGTFWLVNSVRGWMAAQL
jgi:para-aminobenzoate synthetase/4-amino-4-deoxychorismate lyase